MDQYLALMKDVLDNGTMVKTRTASGLTAYRKTVYGRQLRFDLTKGLPIITTKRVFYRGVIEELIWFLNGETNCKSLEEKGVYIWSDNAGEDGELTVLGIMGTEGKNSAPFQFLEKFLPVEKEESKIVDEAFNLNLNLPANHKDYFHYSGSLTTPPCSENVNWIVFKEPITLSLEQVKVLRSLMPVNNYRNEQPLNDRVVLRSF